MKKLTILTFEEGSRLEWQKAQTLFFRESGDYTSYLMPPCIVLSELIDIRVWIDIGDGILSHTGRIERISGLWCIGIENPPFGYSCGIYLSSAEEKPSLPSYLPESVKIKAIAEAETDGKTFRIVQSHSLKRDTAR